MERNVTDSPHVAAVKAFFEFGDGKNTSDIKDLFAQDIQVFFPKYGVKKGIPALMAMGASRYAMFPIMQHHIDDFKYIEQGNTVVVEGTTEGETAKGRKWNGKDRVCGLFVSVFEFRDDQITRMHVYLDPDLGMEDCGRYTFHTPESMPKPPAH
jgi:ketosteroid isomerase-like protein